MTPDRRILTLVALAVGVLVVVGASLRGRTSTPDLANRNPIGEAFPTVVGQSLEKERVELPSALAGEPAVLLVGYRQEAQFDIDRWLMGLIQSEVDARILEVPTIPGLLPSFASRWIDEGMRSGIPREDWGAVVTLYGEAARPVAELTGTERGRLTRVLVLDADGDIVWFDDEGYSPRKALEVTEVVSELRGRGADPTRRLD